LVEKPVFGRKIPKIPSAVEREWSTLDEKVQKKCKKSAKSGFFVLERDLSTFRLKKTQKSAKKCKICKKVQKITFFLNPWPGGLEIPKKTGFLTKKFGQPKTRKSAHNSFCSKRDQNVNHLVHPKNHVFCTIFFTKKSLFFSPVLGKRNGKGPKIALFLSATLRKSPLSFPIHAADQGRHRETCHKN
jgi:hypothetical protein